MIVCSYNSHCNITSVFKMEMAAPACECLSTYLNLFFFFPSLRQCHFLSCIVIKYAHAFCMASFKVETLIPQVGPHHAWHSACNIAGAFLNLLSLDVSDIMLSWLSSHLFGLSLGLLRQEGSVLIIPSTGIYLSYRTCWTSCSVTL